MRNAVAVERSIAAPRQHLFDLIANPATHPVIDGTRSVLSPRDSAPQRLQLGATFGMDMKRGAKYRITNTVVEFVEGEQIAWRHFAGHIWRYQFADTADGTRVTETFDYTQARCKICLKVAGFPAKNRAAMVETLARLDRYVLTGDPEG
jgi:uncharacterized protein YndB with AHSA1/START domain